MHPHILPRTVYAGTFIHINCSTELCVQEQTIVAVNEHGKIVAIFSFEEGTYNERDGVESDKVTAQPKLGLGAWEEGTLRDEWIDFRVKSLGWGERITGREENNCEGWELVLAGKGGWWFPGFVGEFSIFRLFETLRWINSFWTGIMSLCLLFYTIY